LRLQNAVGSQLLDLPIPMEVQYWNGSGFVRNAADSCTTVGAANFALGNYQKNLVAGETALSVAGPFNAGVASLKLSAPGNANNGSVDVSVNLSASAAGASCTGAMPASTALSRTYLQGPWCTTAYSKDPTARATFGLFNQNAKVVYSRENY
jgi:MSHA biogenesis protein MshQ